MAASFAPNLSSYQTALVLLPPKQIAERLNPFRLVHDKSAQRWTAHFTLQFPFVEAENFPETIARLEQALTQVQPFSFRLDAVGKFSLAGYDSVHLTTSDETVRELYSVISTTLKYSGRPFKPHLTLGQASHKSPEAIQFLESKAQLLLDSVQTFDWNVRSILLLKKDESDGGIMKFYHELFLAGQTITSYQVPPSFPTAHLTDGSWEILDNTNLSPLSSSLTVLSYNILHDEAFPLPNRFPSIVETITASKADIVCLQEVTDESRRLLLTSSLVSLYTYSSRHPDIVCENERNILVLSKYPFTWNKLDVGSKHKPAFIATFLGESGRRTILAAVHLTAGRAASPLEQKTAELEAVVSHLYNKHSADDWIIAGDTNWPNNRLITPADDLFIDAGLVSSHPATYDPTDNRLAAFTARDSSDPQRYDRVYVKRTGDWMIKQTMVLGASLEGNPPSDHYALQVDLTIKPPDNPSESPPSFSFESLPQTALETAELKRLARKHSVVPTAEQTTNMENAFKTLEQIICNPGTAAPNVHLHLEKIGSFALGIHTNNSDVDTLAVGNISTPTFWALAKSRIRASGDTVKLKRFVKNAIVPRMELDVQGIKMDMQYCAAPQLAGARWKELADIPSDSSLFHLPSSSLVTLNSYRDSLTLRRVLPNLANFRIAHLALKQYLTSQGLSGARFGFLGGFHLTLLLTRVALTLPRDAQPHHLVRRFFSLYSTWNWERDMVWPIPSRETDSSISYRRTSHKEPIVVLSIEKPLANLTFHASHNSLATMVKSFQVADKMLSEDKPWEVVCGLDDAPEQQFLNAYKLFIRLDVHYWGSSSLPARELIGWLESRLVSLLVQLHTAVPDIHARFWPQRFVDADSNHEELNGFYLFGLTPSDSTPITDKQALARKNAVTESALSRCLRTFEEDLRQHEGYHDPTSSTFIAVSLVKGTQLAAKVIVDPFVFPDDGVEVVDDEEEDSDGSADSSQPETSAVPQRKRNAAKTKTSHVPAPSKLRTSTDVFNRLVWDPATSKENYAIGYEDRFVGIKETALGSWSREVESESFIPFHRVVYFKRVSDGVIVWDKRTKIDLIFGSGVGAG